MKSILTRITDTTKQSMNIKTRSYHILHSQAHRHSSRSLPLKPSIVSNTYHHHPWVDRGRSFYQDSIDLLPLLVQSPLPPGSKPIASKIRMILLGAPGSGKGTLCKKLMETFGLDMIGTGDLLRQNVVNQTQVGKIAEQYISKGALLPDNIILELVKPEVEKLKDRNWILDGFPRTRSQAIHLDSFLREDLDDQLNLVISLQVPDDVIIKRITDRWIHAPSGRIYNTTYNPPRIEGKDDLTGESLTKRKDDTIEVFSTRLKSFHLENEPLLNYYDHQFILTNPPEFRKRKKLVHYFGQTTDQIWPEMIKTIQQRFPHLTVLKKPDN